MSVLIKCPVCENSNINLLYPVAEGKLVSCTNCSSIFFTPQPTSEELALFYNSNTYRKDYENSCMAGQKFAEERYDRLCKIISYSVPSLLSKSDKQFLDIGCAVGDLLYVAQQNGWHVTGTELSPQSVEKANHRLNNKVLAGDILSLDLPDNFYDLITIYHVIEHLLDPIETLVKIRHLLKPGGIAFIETPNIASLGAKIRGKNWSHIIPPEHLIYFQPSSLRFALEKAGFQNFKVFTNSPPVVDSVSNWIEPFKTIATQIYRVTPLFGLGAALQALAFKE